MRARPILFPPVALLLTACNSTPATQNTPSAPPSAAVALQTAAVLCIPKNAVPGLLPNYHFCADGLKDWVDLHPKAHIETMVTIGTPNDSADKGAPDKLLLTFRE